MNSLQKLCRRLHNQGIEMTPQHVLDAVRQSLGGEMRTKQNCLRAIKVLLSDRECFDQFIEQIIGEADGG